MLENKKGTFQEMKEKGKKWFTDNRGTIGYLAGAAVATGGYIIAKQINKPKKAAICFTPDKNDPDRIIGQVWWKNRFNREYHFVNIDYGHDDNGTVKNIRDSLGELLHSGD